MNQNRILSGWQELSKFMIQNLEAEKSILGSILQKPDTLLSTSDIISAEDFLDIRHKLIYNALLDLYQLREPIDLITVVDRLQTKGELETVKASYVASLIENFYTAPIKHAEIVKHKSLVRKIKNWFKAETDKTENDIEDIKKWLGDIEANVIELAQEIKVKKSPHAIDIIYDIHQDWQNPAKKYIPIQTFEEFNKEAAIPGFMPGHLYVIGGYTSVGKSTLLAQLAIDVCEQEKSVCIFSIEDSRQEKMFKIIGNIANVTQRKLITGNITGYESRISDAEARIKKYKLSIYDDINTVDQIRLKIKKHKLQQGLDVVFLDYIQNIGGSPKIYERMSSAILSLWNMAKELQITMVVLSQVSNEAMRSDSEVIGLKGAGELASSADVVLWLSRTKGDGKERLLNCDIRKNRAFGVTGMLLLQFSEFFTRIEARSR